MIGKLKGIVDSVEDEALILDVNGVGYLVSASARTLRAIPAVGEPAELLIETYVREDAIRLYGFLHGGRARLVSLAAKRAGRRRQGRARDSRRALGGSVEHGGRAARQGDDGARAGGRPEARRAPRARAQGQGAGDVRRRFRPCGIQVASTRPSSPRPPRTRCSPSLASATPRPRPPPRWPGFPLSSDRRPRPPRSSARA